MPPAQIALILIGLLLQNAALVAVAAWALHCQGSSLRRAGLTRPTAKQVWWGIGLGLAGAGAAYCLDGLELWACRVLLSEQTFHALQAWNDQMSAVHTFRLLHASPAILVFVLIGTLAAPLGEEAFFRGWLCNALQQRWGATVGVVGSALLFALLHISPLNLLPLFMLGLLLAVAYLRTGSLWVPIIIHAVNNGLAFALLARSVSAG